jgi:hypothetical protein
MQVRNSYNTPSFGMAFVKPNVNEMSEFSKDVFGNRSIKFVKKGLIKVIEREKDNRFDVRYKAATPGSGSAFCVMDWGSAEKVLHTFPLMETSYPSKFELKMRKCEADMDNANNNVKRTFIVTKAAFLTLKEYVKLKCNYVDPTDVLPAALRKALDTADELNRAKLKDMKKLNAAVDAWNTQA